MHDNMYVHEKLAWHVARARLHRGQLPLELNWHQYCKLHVQLQCATQNQLRHAHQCWPLTDLWLQVPWLVYIVFIVHLSEMSVLAFTVTNSISYHWYGVRQYRLTTNCLLEVNLYSHITTRTAGCRSIRGRTRWSYCFLSLSSHQRLTTTLNNTETHLISCTLHLQHRTWLDHCHTSPSPGGAWICVLDLACIPETHKEEDRKKEGKEGYVKRVVLTSIFSMYSVTNINGNWCICDSES